MRQKNQIYMKVVVTSRKCFDRTLRLVEHFRPCPISANAILYTYPPRQSTSCGRYVSPTPVKYNITVVIVPLWDENLKRESEGEWLAGRAEMYVDEKIFNEETGGEVIITELDKVEWNGNMYKVDMQDAYHLYSNTSIYNLIKIPNSMKE